MHIVMTWSKQHQQYLMTAKKDGRFIYNFWDCGGVRMIFRGVNKTKATEFNLIARRKR